MTNMLMLCFFVVAIFSVVELWREKKHDVVLFPLCQLRRDIMKYLRESVREDGVAISKQDGEAVLQILGVLNGVISNYNEHKTHMFNVRNVVKYLDQHKDVLEKVAPLAATKNPQIKNFHHRFAYCSAKAFLAYTPLIRSQATVVILVFLAMWVHRTGSKAISERLKQESKQIRDVASHVGAAAV